LNRWRSIAQIAITHPPGPETHSPSKIASLWTRSIGGDQQALHPLLAWWAILFALSMLARYQPDTWTDYLDVDKSPAVPVETLLDRALLTCPELLLHAIRSVSR
jgi:hypothetical protein